MGQENRPERVKRCGSCGSERVVPVMYGLPGPEALQQAERGEIHLGGCIVGPGQPSWACDACGATCSRDAGWRPRRPASEKGDPSA